MRSLTPLPPLHPAFKRLPSPVIIIGTGRSGTSVAAAMLARLGVFMGSELQSPADAEEAVADARVRSSGYGEAAEFYQLNELLLRRAGAAWNRVEPFLATREERTAADASLLLLRSASYGRLRTGYLRALHASGLQQWGWKDPRNSLTLPYWLQLFPEARVLHVRRSLSAVAESIHRRSLLWQEQPTALAPPRFRDRLGNALLNPGRTLRTLGSRSRSAAPADPCLDLEYCLRLSEQYERECLQYRQLGRGYLEMSYEEMLAEPEAAAEQLAGFAGCAPARADLARAAALVSRNGARYTSPEAPAKRARPCPRPEPIHPPTRAALTR